VYVGNNQLTTDKLVFGTSTLNVMTWLLKKKYKRITF